jgi:hypothetical protein
MSEENREIQPAPPRVYRWALNKVRAEKAHSNAFDGLVGSVPEERRKKLTPILQRLHDSTQKNLLDPDKMQELSKRDNGLFEEINGYYTGYLKKLAGLAE